MLRRDFIRLGGIAAAASALTACGGSTPAAAAGPQAPAVRPAKKYRWTCTMAVPRTFPLWSEAIFAFAKRVKEASGGRLDIEVVGKGDKVKSLGATFDAVRSGRIEMAHAAAYYWYDKTPELKAAPFFTTVPFGMDAGGMSAWLNVGGGQQLWDELYAPLGLKALPCGNTGVQAGGWFRKPIASVADFQGLKMRIPGFGGKTLTKVGAVAENIAAGEIYLALETGRIDATEWVGPYHDLLQKFHKVAKHYYTGGWHEPGSTLELLINKKAWDGLPADLRAIVTACAGECDRTMAAMWTAKDAEAYQQLKAIDGLSIGPFPQAVVDALRPKAEEVLAEVRDATPIGKKIHDSYRTFQATYQEWFGINNLNYLKSWSS